MDDEPPRKPSTYQIGQNIEDMSVDELNETVSLLKEEIDRLEAASKSKSAHLSAAEALFGRK